MTRQEQIDAAACDQSESCGYGKDGVPRDLYDGFVRGAQWADANPNELVEKIIDDRVAMISEISVLEQKLAVAVEALKQVPHDYRCDIDNTLYGHDGSCNCHFSEVKTTLAKIEAMKKGE